MGRRKGESGLIARVARALREQPQRLKLEVTDDQAIQEAIRKLADSQAFVIGRYVQHQLAQGIPIPEIRSHDELLVLLSPYLVRDYDRARFGLPPATNA